MSSLSQIPLPLLFFSLSVLLPFVSAAPTYLITYCPNTTVFPATNTAFRSNINSLLSTLSSSANRSSAPGFNYTSTTSSSVYGFYLCRGDDDPATCRDCVAAASVRLPKDCPRETEAIIWYDECIIRYSNQSFFSKLDSNFAWLLYNTLKVTTNATGFNEVLQSTLAKTATVAASGNATEKFATEQGILNSFQSVYALGQCTPDLSTSDCTQCLKQCITSMPGGGTLLGARVLFLSCNLRYEMYKFYRAETAAPAPAPNRTPSGGGGAGRGGGKKSSSKVVIGIVVGVSAGLLLLGAISCLVKTNKKKKLTEVAVIDLNATEDFSTAESLQYGFDTLQAATNNFSDENKVGEGGFGVVYKGILTGGQQVAIKRLSRSSNQGAEEFKNEIVLVAKLQHRNLVQLLGFCLTADEKLVVYEYFPNKSLNFFLFDPVKQGQLYWSMRYKIILGIARGMLYLHEDSRLRIIHRDLKASNVLLDSDMNPKISDFGIAWIFGGDESHGNTNRIVGTYGYMSPEYAMQGQFSVKSDVYSFGVLVLEIISGKRNTTFYVSGYAEDLLSFGWKLWSEGRPMEFVDETLRDSCSSSEVMRCIHIGLLCIQDEINQRPTMASIVLMLNSHSMSLSAPLEPAFFARSKTYLLSSTEKLTCTSAPLLVNDVSITEVDSR